MQEEEPLFEYVPAAQLLQEEAPLAGECVPGEQLVHWVAAPGPE